MSDTPKSPTGTPVIPPQYVPFLMALLTAVNGGLAYLSQQDVSPTVKMLCTVLLAVLGPLMAALSPGLRKSDGAAALKALLVVAALGVAVVPAPARAEGFLDAFDYGMGPTIPLLQFPLGVKAPPVQFAPGTGIQLNATPKALQFEWLGKKWDLVSVNVFLFGSLITGEAGRPLGQLSGAGGVSILSSLVSFGIGGPFLSEGGVPFPGKPFALLSLNLNLLLQPPVTAFDKASWAGLPRANALYF